MEMTQHEIDEIVRLLTRTPERITAVAQTLTPAQLHTKANAQTWSANDILAHLRACVDVWGEDIDAMLAHNSPTLRHLSPRTYLRQTNYAALDFGPSFQMFCEQRAELLTKLHSLPLADWSRDAQIKERRHTVFSHARRMALHEAAHCEQIESLIGG